MAPAPFRVGLLVPSSNTTMEGDFHRELPPEVEIATARMFLPETTRAAEAEMLEGHLTRANLDLATVRPDLTVFGCTSGGALGGRAHDRAIVRKIEEETGAPAVSILSALAEEFGLLGARRLLLLTPYIEELTAAVRDSLREEGFDVLAAGGMGITDNLRIGRQGAAEIIAFARAAFAPGALKRADCLFISCTNLPAVGALPALRAHFAGLPLMTSNLAVIQAVRRRFRGAASPLAEGAGRRPSPSARP